MRLCDVEGCGRKHDARGLCAKHRQREYARANPEVVRATAKRSRNRAHGKRCSIEGCDRPHSGKGLCIKHYLKRYAATAHGRAVRRASADREIGFNAELTKTLLLVQSGRCAICRCSFDGKERSVQSMQRDHDHITGKARGLLCATCNLVLGKYEKFQRPSGLRVEPYENYLSAPPTTRTL